MQLQGRTPLRYVHLPCFLDCLEPQMLGLKHMQQRLVVILMACAMAAW